MKDVLDMLAEMPIETLRALMLPPTNTYEYPISKPQEISDGESVSIKLTLTTE
jgi:hypothetical protein